MVQRNSIVFDNDLGAILVAILDANLGANLSANLNANLGAFFSVIFCTLAVCAMAPLLGMSLHRAFGCPTGPTPQQNLDQQVQERR